MTQEVKSPQDEAKVAQEYVVNSDGWVAGYRRKAGETVELTKGQAKYEDVTLKEENAAPKKERKPAAKGKAS
ncbi:hypothetical protein [Profundibacter sp.]